MNWFTIYLLTRCDAIRSVMEPISIVSLIFFVVSYAAILLVSSSDDDDLLKIVPLLQRTRNFLFIVLLVSGGLKILSPTKTDIAIIIAGNWAVNSENTNKLPENVVNTMNRFMDDYINIDEILGHEKNDNRR